MRRLPPPHPAGSPKTPGSGRRKGSLNRRTVELRALMASLAGDLRYQGKLREAFVKRRVHPSTEMRVWEYSIGRPKEQIEMSAKVSMDDRLAAERALFARLSVEEMEEIAAARKRWSTRRWAMVQAQRVLPATTLPVALVTPGESSPQPGVKPTGTDVDDA